MPRRTPNGETDIEVLADHARKLERRVKDLEGLLAGRLPHRHDARYVETAGDTMTGGLTVGGNLFAELGGGPRVNAVQFGGPNNESVLYRQFDDNGTERNRIYFANHFTPPRLRLRKYDSSGSTVCTLDIGENGVVTVLNDLDVVGSKNARIADPADPTRAWRYAAMEADEPGLLCTRLTVTVPDGSGQTATPLPGHWARIARDADAWATPRSGDGAEQRDGRAWPRASVDLTVPEVSVHAPPSEYRVLVMACRSDLDGRWSHEVAVDPEQDDV